MDRGNHIWVLEVVELEDLALSQFLDVRCNVNVAPIWRLESLRVDHASGIRRLTPISGGLNGSRIKASNEHRGIALPDLKILKA